jgi:hypothetical protein
MLRVLLMTHAVPSVGVSAQLMNVSVLLMALVPY